MDAIVIGAGLSGLAAANRLVRGGRTVMLVEARSRIGGRVFSLRSGGNAIELGAEWVGNSGVLHDLLTDAGASVKEVDGNYLRRTPDGYRNAWDPEENAQPVLKRATSIKGPDRSLASALKELGVDAKEARPTLMYVQGFHAADPDKVGIQWLGEVEETQPAMESSFRCVDGLDRAFSALRDDLGAACDICLETIARAVRWGPYGVEVDVDGKRGRETLRASAAIVTIPHAVLDTLSIDPPLDERRKAAALVHTGAVLKVVLHARTRFWEAIEALDDMAFLFAMDEAFPTIWRGEGDGAVLNVWTGGPNAARLGTMADAEIVAAATRSVANAMRLDPGFVEQQIVHAHFHNWMRDPFARGAYTYVGVGGSRAHEILAHPAGNVLFFAGEATIGSGYNATMEGAVRSGIRAAEELLSG